MSTDVRVEFNHFPAVIAAFLDVEPEIVAKVGSDIEAHAKTSMVGGGSPHAPSSPGNPPHVDTGNLKNSLVFEMTGKNSGEVRVMAEYGAFLEYGTVRMAPRPFLTPAVDKVADKLEDIGIEVVTDALPRGLGR